MATETSKDLAKRREVERKVRQFANLSYRELDRLTAEFAEKHLRPSEHSLVDLRYIAHTSRVRQSHKGVGQNGSTGTPLLRGEVFDECDELRAGDTIRFSDNVTPAYLQGLTAEIIGFKRYSYGNHRVTKVLLSLPDTPQYYTRRGGTGLYNLNAVTTI